MKYHLFVLQMNGDITARQECDSRKALGDPAVRHLIQEYSELLEKQFADNPEKRGKFWFPPDESARYRWKWDQFNPLSALCVMEVAGQPISACVFLYPVPTSGPDYNRHQRSDCYTIAYIYYVALYWRGGSAYKGGQKHCHPSCPSIGG